MAPSKLQLSHNILFVTKEPIHILSTGVQVGMETIFFQDGQGLVMGLISVSAHLFTLVVSFRAYTSAYTVLLAKIKTAFPYRQRTRPVRVPKSAHDQWETSSVLAC